MAASARRCAFKADTRKLAAYGLNIDDLRTTIGNANVDTPKGNFDGPTRSYTINANDQLQDAAAYMDLVIAYRNGDPVRLSDVATSVEQRGEQQARRLDEHDPGGDPQHPAPARRQRHRRWWTPSRRCCRGFRRRSLRPST